jgi:dihydropteroate synthase
MGILNVTPDSFYDGGKYRRLDSALRRAEKMAEEGADILDVGGESSRPGSGPVSAEEECRRVVPVVRSLSRRFPKIPISVDTQKSDVACRSLSEGARILNDISALSGDPEMIRVALRFKPWIVLMHMRGNPQTMQRLARYKNVAAEVKKFLSDRIRWAVSEGLERKKLIVDPGIGFGKTVEHNLELLRFLKNFLSLGCPVLAGASRKFFIGAVLGGGADVLSPEERLEGSLGCAAWCALEGASILRVHDVGATRKVLRMIRAIKGSSG